METERNWRLKETRDREIRDQEWRPENKDGERPETERNQRPREIRDQERPKTLQTEIDQRPENGDQGRLDTKDPKLRETQDSLWSLASSFCGLPWSPSVSGLPQSPISLRLQSPLVSGLQSLSPVSLSLRSHSVSGLPWCPVSHGLWSPMDSGIPQSQVSLGLWSPLVSGLQSL